MEAHLIAEVSKYPILFDTSLEEYKQVELKNNAWKEITGVLFNSTNPFIVEKVKNKWKNLRDTFVKAQRKKDRGNCKPWKLESEMKFLIPYLNPKLTQLSSSEGAERFSYERLSSPEQHSRDNKILESYLKRDDENDGYRGGLEDSILMQQVETVMEDSPRSQPMRKRRRESLNSEAVRHFLDVSEPTENHLRGEQASPIVPLHCDAIDAYFMGLAQTVKRLKPVNQVLLKKAISILIFDAELKETEATCEATSSS